MDLQTLVTSVVASGLVSVTAVKALAKTLVDHELGKRQRDHQHRLDEALTLTKSSLDRSMAAATAQLQADLRLRVDDYLGARAADRAYELEARKRLHTAVGPLRCQLVIACDDLANRVHRIGTGRQPYRISIAGYFGRSTVYRVLRVLALAELIERQMAYADFSVDPAMVCLRRFRKSALLCMSSSRVPLDHPGADWNSQVEHIFYDTLSIVAARMIVTDSRTNEDRVLQFDEFAALIATDEGRSSLEPASSVFDHFTVADKPILWLRLVALGQLASWLVTQEGPAMGVDVEPFDAAELLRLCPDRFVQDNLGRLETALRSLIPDGSRALGDPGSVRSGAGDILTAT